MNAKATSKAVVNQPSRKTLNAMHAYICEQGRRAISRRAQRVYGYPRAIAEALVSKGSELTIIEAGYTHVARKASRIGPRQRAAVVRLPNGGLRISFPGRTLQAA
jgi:hypothetical protein